MPDDWRIPQNFRDHLDSQSKKMMHEQRRPMVSQPSDIMGPGLAPFSVATTNWSSDECAFNGFFFSAPGDTNAPDSVRGWIGQTISTADGVGLQEVTSLEVSPQRFYREFTSPIAGIRTYTAWVEKDAVQSVQLSVSVAAAAGAGAALGTSMQFNIISAGPDSRWQVFWSADTQVGTAGTTAVSVRVDGVVIPGSPQGIVAGPAGLRGPASNQWPVTGLAVGVHIIDFTATQIGGAASVLSQHTTASLHRVR